MQVSKNPALMPQIVRCSLPPRQQNCGGFSVPIGILRLRESPDRGPLLAGSSASASAVRRGTLGLTAFPFLAQSIGASPLEPGGCGLRARTAGRCVHRLQLKEGPKRETSSIHFLESLLAD